MKRLAWVLVPAALFVVAACYNSTDMQTCHDDTAAIQKDILGPRCGMSGCHGSDPASNVDFVSAGLEARLVGVPADGCGGQIFVVAGDPGSSYLVHKVSDATPTCGKRMPFGATALDAESVACLRSWVTKLGSASADGGTDGSPGTDGGGVDAGPTCPAGQTSCNSKCVDTTNDKNNCGKCGTVCPVACSASACVTTCPSPTTNCNGSCVDLTKDAANCSACGKACPSGQICSASACSCGASVSFAGAVQPVFTASCAINGCHSGVAPKASLNLGSGKSYAQLVNVPANACSSKIRVVPANVDLSYLMNKLNGVGMCSGTQMPKIGTSLPQAQFGSIQGWICNGAPNN